MSAAHNRAHDYDAWDDAVRTPSGRLPPPASVRAAPAARPGGLPPKPSAGVPTARPPPSAPAAQRLPPPAVAGTDANQVPAAPGLDVSAAKQPLASVRADTSNSWDDDAADDVAPVGASAVDAARLAPLPAANSFGNGPTAARAAPKAQPAPLAMSREEKKLELERLREERRAVRTLRRAGLTGSGKRSCAARKTALHHSM